MSEIITLLNEEVVDKLKKIPEEMNKIIDDSKKYASRKLKNFQEISSMRFRFECSKIGSKNFLSEDDFYIFFQFAEKYLAVEKSVNSEPHRIIRLDGKFYLKNDSYPRSIINNFRPLIFNQNDSVFYTRIHKLLQDLLEGSKKKQGKITVLSGDVDVTSIYLDKMSYSRGVIVATLSAIKQDLVYIYNGVLSHSDGKFSKRMEEDVYTGELHYIILKNAAILTILKDFFNFYWDIMRTIGIRSNSYCLIK